MSDAPEKTTTGRCPAWMKATLVLSLAANIGIAGLFLGNQMKEKENAYGANRQIAWILKLVPDEQHDFTKAQFEARRDELRKAHTERDRHMDAIVRAIRAEPFSPEELNRAMRLRREAGDVRRVIVHKELLDVLVAFSRTDRALFADRLEERLDQMSDRSRSGN
ncbi:MAG: hypothetical protein AAGB15_09830 [Pseudomonadota bacterium]